VVSHGGELERDSVLAGLAHARYMPESGCTNDTGSFQALTVITTLEEARLAVSEVAARAERLLSIYTPDLEPQLYDQSEFLEVVKHLVLTRPFAKVRVLLTDSGHLGADGHRFVAMARRLTSCIDVRTLAPRSDAPHCAYVIADERAILYRLRADGWEGIADLDNPPVARLYLHEFAQLWDTCEPAESLQLVRRA
jgi:hypothetical protein